MVKTISTAKFSISASITQSIREFIKNEANYRSIFAIIKNDVFVFGYQGGNFNEQFTRDERERLGQILLKIDDLFDICKEVSKVKTATLDQARQLWNTLGYVHEKKSKNERFSDQDLLNEAYAVTEFWKGMAEEGYVYNCAEAIACLTFHDWLNGFIGEVQVVLKEQLFG